MKKKRILLVIMKYAYGEPKREYSYEYFNFYLTLKNMGHEVELFDFMGEISVLGKTSMNNKLIERVKELKPDIAVFSLYTDQFNPTVVNEVRKFTKTFCFFHDDTWRVEYSCHWANQFDYFSTPDIYGELKYREIGLSNAVYFPFGCNEQIFQRFNIPKIYDVSFVGAWHPYREWLINRVRKSGVDVQVFGYGWPQGEVDQQRMVSIFNQSKINLNLSNSAPWDMRYLISSPRGLLNRLHSRKNIEQMKARIFEVNGCGGFQLSYYVEGLANCYEIDRELAVYADADDLVNKVKFYLAHDDLRGAISDAGHQRTIQNHTFSQRFKNVFSRMGFVNE